MKLDEIIKNYTHYLTDENQNKWKVIETSDIEEICKEYHKQQLILSGVSKSFALGKEAIIVECFKGHEFEDGEVVEIVEKFDNELWIAKSKATGKEWYITEEEANVC